MVNRVTPPDLVAGAFSAGAVAFFVILDALVARRASTLEAVSTGAGAAAGVVATLLVWARAGRPPPERLLRDHPVLALKILALFTGGFVVALIFWGNH